jgi:Ca2+-binding RTX toxin-like protein
MIPIVVTFSEPVDVIGAVQLDLNDGGVANYTSGSGTSTLTFTQHVAIGQNTADLDYISTGALTLNGGSISDMTGAAAGLSLPPTGSDGLATTKIVIDTTPSTVTAVSSSKPPGMYGLRTTVPITLAFSSAIDVSGSPQLTLNDGGVASYASGSGTSRLSFSYTVAAGQNTPDLDYASPSALILNGGSVKDLAGMAAALTLPAAGTDGLASKNINIDTTPLTVTSVSSTQTPGTYLAGTEIPITVNFSSAVIVNGWPQLLLNDGGTANYNGGSGSSSLSFTYTVTSGQHTADLDYASTNALLLNSGTMTNLAGSPAVLTLPATGTDGLAADDIAVALAATKVAFIQMQGGTSAGAVLSPVKVAVEYATGAIAGGDTSYVTLALQNSAGAVLSGTLTQAAVGGVATFSDLSINLPGTYALVAGDGSLIAAVSPSFTLAPQQPATFATLSGGALLVQGTSGDDIITVQTDGNGNLTATLNGVTSRSFALASITSIDVEAGAGNDLVTIDSSMPASLGVSVQGGAGDDTIMGGPGNDTLCGGQGNDSISGGPGDDSIKGGGGDDLLAGGKGNDTLLGGVGNDTLRGALGDDSLNGGAGTNQLYGGQGDNIFDAVNGTADQIFAGAAANDSVLYGSSDNYVIESGAIPPGNMISSS